MQHSLEHIASVIKEARKHKGLSQRELSAKTGLTQSQISRIENSAVDPQTSSLIAIARALDLEPMLVPRQFVSAVRDLQRAAQAQERDTDAQPFTPAYRLEDGDA